MTNIINRQKNKVPATFENVVDHIFQSNLNRFFDDAFWGFDGRAGNQQVPVNIRETENAYEIELIAPGLKKQDFQLSVSRDLLTVSFENQQQSEEQHQDQGWIKKEYHTSSFSRSFSLNDMVDASNIQAKYENGVLAISLPKKADAQQVSRNVEIQ
jgi:HSP20 family protein